LVILFVIFVKIIQILLKYQGNVNIYNDKGELPIDDIDPAFLEKIRLKKKTYGGKKGEIIKEDSDEDLSDDDEEKSGEK
jgi:hypothetical protein